MAPGEGKTSVQVDRLDNGRAYYWRAWAEDGANTGTAATAAGPHSGGAVGERIHRLYFKGADTLTWVVHRHATIAALFGVIAIGAGCGLVVGVTSASLPDSSAVNSRFHSARCRIART